MPRPRSTWISSLGVVFSAWSSLGYAAASTRADGAPGATTVTAQTPVGAAPASLVTCGGALSALSADGRPVRVTFASPTVAGGEQPVTITCSPASGSLFPVGTTSLTCTAIDSLQRSASCNSVVVVSGPPPLAITCPVPRATSVSGNPVAVTYAPVVAGGAKPLGMSCTPPSGSQFPVGATSLTCHVVDALKRVASCKGSVVVAAPRKTVKTSHF